MAEIRIEKKSRAWIWWLVGLLVLALLIWLIAGSGYDNRTATTTETATGEQTTAATASGDDNPYNAYSIWVNNEQNMGVHHEYSQQGIKNLSDAIAYTAQQQGLENEIHIKSELDKMRKMADEITDDWQSTDHADKINRAFTQAAITIEKIQEHRFSNLENDVEELKEMAGEVDKNTLTLEQKEDVKSFFAKADEVLNKMNK